MESINAVDVTGVAKEKLKKTCVLDKK